MLLVYGLLPLRMLVEAKPFGDVVHAFHFGKTAQERRRLDRNFQQRANFRNTQGTSYKRARNLFVMNHAVHYGVVALLDTFHRRHKLEFKHQISQFPQIRQGRSCDERFKLCTCLATFTQILPCDSVMQPLLLRGSPEQLQASSCALPRLS